MKLPRKLYQQEKPILFSTEIPQHPYLYQKNPDHHMQSIDADGIHNSYNKTSQ
jgi:hypothetical protein